MIARIGRPGRVYAVLTVLGAGAIAALLSVYLYQDAAGRNALLIEMAKGLIQFIAMGIIAALVKFLFDSYQEDQRRIDALNDFRGDKIRRLVQVTNALRGATILIDARRSARTYNEQMRKPLDASLELRLIRNEINAVGPDEANTAFPIGQAFGQNS